jgi:hypothetical protein
VANASLTLLPSFQLPSLKELNISYNQVLSLHVQLYIHCMMTVEFYMSKDNTTYVYTIKCVTCKMHYDNYVMHVNDMYD